MGKRESAVLAVPVVSCLSSQAGAVGICYGEVQKCSGEFQLGLKTPQNTEVLGDVWANGAKEEFADSAFSTLFSSSADRVVPTGIHGSVNDRRT